VRVGGVEPTTTRPVIVAVEPTLLELTVSPPAPRINDPPAVAPAPAK